MSVFVDDAFIPYRGMKMCHMIADTTEELLAMVRRIGVQEKWIQKAGTPDEHFDIAGSKRILALQHGAIAVTTRKLAMMNVNRRRAQRGLPPEDWFEQRDTSTSAEVQAK